MGLGNWVSIASGANKMLSKLNILSKIVTEDTQPVSQHGETMQKNKTEAETRAMSGFSHTRTIYKSFRITTTLVTKHSNVLLYSQCPNV